MLELLRIKDVAIIDETEIFFKQGLNIISGETGAGKSIIIESISLLLGDRAHSDFIRKGAEEAVVEGLFDLSSSEHSKTIRHRLKEMEINFDENENTLLIRRTISRSGKSRTSINGAPATLHMLQSVASGLVDICGQHEHQSLSQPLSQIQLLDIFGGLTSKSLSLAQEHKAFLDLKKEIFELESQIGAKDRQIDFVRFQIQELEGANLQKDEDLKLQEEKKFLTSIESRLRFLSSAVSALDGVDSDSESSHLGAIGLVGEALGKLRQLQTLDSGPELHQAINHLENGLSEVELSSSILARLQNGTAHNEDRLNEVQERLASLASLKRKYSVLDLNEVVERLESLRQQLELLEQAETILEQKKKSLVELSLHLTKDGKALHLARASVAKTFSDSITHELKALQMPHAEFSVSLANLETPDRWELASPSRIEYLIRTNKGEEAKALQKIVSGGELSRLMLAVRHVISDRGGIGVYLFDEIDSGMSGSTAFVVGKKLKSVSKHNQVICITHLPQVAAFADHHLVVVKEQTRERTLAQVITLKKPARKEELARMMGGEKLTKTNLKNAEELLETAQAAI